ncbi:hypothetical protein BKA93DRAFT_752682 [Sparassis latifolia]
MSWVVAQYISQQLPKAKDVELPEPDITRRSCKIITPGISLPPNLLEHARKPSIVGGRQQTAIDLGLWAPPYTFNPAGLQKESKGSPSTEHEHPNISEEAHLKLGQVSELERRCLTRALGSRQFTLLVEAGRQRSEIWDEKEDIQDQILAMERELTARTRAWVDLHGASWEDGRVTTGRDVALDWGAKIICTLARELEIVQKGEVEYMRSLEVGKLPWQHMNTVH